jgi:hypothetical protein
MRRLWLGDSPRSGADALVRGDVDASCLSKGERMRGIIGPLWWANLYRVICVPQSDGAKVSPEQLESCGPRCGESDISHKKLWMYFLESFHGEWPPFG